MLVWWGIFIHIIFLLSVFDIYFKSPVIHGVQEYVPIGNFPASRVVLFSADGLRAESLFRSNNVPFLKYLIQEKSIWGISHTRVPTESRPGHVALIAGFYEDPSAIAKGWKENPVEFDSIFNRSRHTWSWGSPDILPMFAKGATGNHIDTFYYSHEEEDFSGKISTAKLDTWVFDQVKEFLVNATDNVDLMELLNKDKVIFFLHLLGLDSAGHTHKPHSKEYEENLKVVDEGIKTTVSLFEQFFHYDKKTIFVFTADHGMTDWGSHGAGEDHETQTPLIVWGAGVPEPYLKVSNADDYFGSPLRKDVNQADICPLMSAFTGIPIPVNSVGVIPESYFEHDLELKARGFHSNARQLLSQYDRKREIVEDYAIKKIYYPFTKLTKSKVENIIREIDTLLENEQFHKVITLSKDTIDLCLEGLEYYQNYYQHFLLFCMSFSFISWILWLLTVLAQGYQSNQNFNKSPVKTKTVKSSKKINILIHTVFGLMLISTLLLIYVQNLPIQYNIYCCLPILLWWKRFLSWKVWDDFFSSKDNSGSSMSNVKFVLTGFLYLVGVSILVTIFFLRWTLSFCLIGVCISQLRSVYNKKAPYTLLFAWILSCVGLGVFSFLPVIGKTENIHLVGASGLLWFVGSLLFLALVSLNFLKSGQETKKENLVLVIPVVMMLVTIQNKYFVDYMFSAKKGLPLVNQILTWILTVMSFITPLQSSHWMLSRLFSIITSFAVFFLLLSVSHEGFFLFILACNLMCWLFLEHLGSNDNQQIQLSLWSFRPKLKKRNSINPINRNLNYDDFRRSFFFLFYIILSFFGTGNIASINSFDPQWVRCFVSQFSPFLMGGLILCKTMVPFLYVACVFCAVNLVVKAPTGQMFLIVLVFSDLMGLHFLHMVTNKGSWLDIGSSISHYVIMETIVLFISILYGLGQILTGISTFSLDDVFKKNSKTNAD